MRFLRKAHTKALSGNSPRDQAQWITLPGKQRRRVVLRGKYGQKERRGSTELAEVRTDALDTSMARAEFSDRAYDCRLGFNCLWGKE